MSATVLLAFGCVGEQFGYDKTRVAMPSSKNIAFPNLVEEFLRNEFSYCAVGQPGLQRLEGNEYVVEYKVRLIRGCVILNNSQWELLQLSFTKTGKNNSEVLVTVDGWVASGFDYPVDSQFTKSMQPEFAQEVTDYTKKIANDFSLYQNSER